MLHYLFFGVLIVAFGIFFFVTFCAFFFWWSFLLLLVLSVSRNQRIIELRNKCLGYAQLSVWAFLFLIIIYLIADAIWKWLR